MKNSKILSGLSHLLNLLTLWLVLSVFNTLLPVDANASWAIKTLDGGTFANSGIAVDSKKMFTFQRFEGGSCFI
jgi:hypothetical protein